jgi:hypothetical protein
MFSIDLVQIAILWSIVGLSIVCAINARGFFRHLISLLITVAIAVVAVLLSYMKFEDIKQGIGLKPACPETSAVSAADSSADSLSSAVSDSASVNYISAEKQLIDEATVILDSIISFPKWEDIRSQGPAKRETFENKALFLRNKSTSSYRQIRNLAPPSDKKDSYDSLLAAAENLRLAGFEIHQQFGLEADSLGESMSKAREHAGAAKITISNIIKGKE